VDVKIGVTDTGRELTVSSGSSPDEIEAKIAYVEIAPADGRRVGFALAT
jgi:hypothetical protein